MSTELKRKFQTCAGCGHRTMSERRAPENRVLYLTQTRREVLAGSVLCVTCDKETVPHDQLHLFITPPPRR